MAEHLSEREFYCMSWNASTAFCPFVSHWVSRKIIIIVNSHLWIDYTEVVICFGQVHPRSYPTKTPSPVQQHSAKPGNALKHKTLLGTPVSIFILSEDNLSRFPPFGSFSLTILFTFTCSFCKQNFSVSSCFLAFDFCIKLWREPTKLTQWY